MPALKQPASLEKLAFAALSKYVYSVGETVFAEICTKSSCPVVTPEEATLKMQKLNLEALNAALYKNIPPVLWCDVTPNMFAGISQLIRNAPCTTDGFLTNGDESCKNFMEELMALFGPYVTHVDFADHAKVSQQFFAKHLDRMPNLKVLNLRNVKAEDVVIEHLAFLTSLTSFTMGPYCSDEIVEVLCNNCKNLETLNVNTSMDVTNDSIRNFMKLQNLENLQIYCTEISQDGVSRILRQPKKIRLPPSFSGQRTDWRGRVILPKSRLPHRVFMYGCDYECEYVNGNKYINEKTRSRRVVSNDYFDTDDSD